MCVVYGQAGRGLCKYVRNFPGCAGLILWCRCEESAKDKDDDVMKCPPGCGSKFIPLSKYTDVIIC